MRLPVPVTGLIAALGESDCERLGTGFLAQPVNAISAVAHVLVGVVVATTAVRAGRAVGGSLVFATCLVAVGAGSVVYHGPQWAGAQLVHDLPILATALFVLNHDVLLVRRSRIVELVSFAAAAVVATAVAIVAPGVVPSLIGAVIVGVLICEIAIAYRGLRRTSLAIIVAAGVAGAAWLLGRSGGPACDADSVVQLHGLWHVASAVVLGLWWCPALAADG